MPSKIIIIRSGNINMKVIIINIIRTKTNDDPILIKYKFKKINYKVLSSTLDFKTFLIIFVII
jgi:hypothetical protein